jgi:hypothetical protein
MESLFPKSLDEMAALPVEELNALLVAASNEYDARVAAMKGEVRAARALRDQKQAEEDARREWEQMSPEKRAALLAHAAARAPTQTVQAHSAGSVRGPR